MKIFSAAKRFVIKANSTYQIKSRVVHEATFVKYKLLFLLTIHLEGFSEDSTQHK